MKKLLLLLIMAMVTACATQPQKITQTSSGWPEIEVFTKDKNAVRENIITRNSETGWNLEQDTPNTLMFTRVDTSGSLGSALTQSLIGNAYSTPPKYEAKYIISSKGNATKIIVNVSISSEMRTGQTNRIFLNNNREVFNIFQKQLQKVKSEIEKS